MRVISSIFIRFFKRNYNLLLFCLIFLLIFRPYNQSFLYLAIWKLLLTATAFAIIFRCNQSPRIKNLELILAVPTIVFCWLDVLFVHPAVFITNVLLSILFTLTCTGTIIYDVLMRIKVTVETLKGVICAYFFVAIAFAYIFWFIEFIQPGSFLLTTVHKDLFYFTQYLSEMIYFSFVTLLTIGYGDVVAVRDFGQTAVILEGIIGQFYVAILVARLVSTYSFYEQSKSIKKSAPLKGPGK